MDPRDLVNMIRDGHEKKALANPSLSLPTFNATPKTGPSVRSRDLELWHEWKRTKSQATLQQLINQLNPLIQSEVNKWSTSLPKAALDGKAKRLAVEALDSYNPNKGVALSTHVVSRLRKLSRTAYTYQNVARIPEHQQLKIHTYNVAQSNLEDKLGRTPTVDELQDELGWSRKHLSDFQRAYKRKEYIESEAHPGVDESDDDKMVDFLYHDLDPTQKKIFEHTTGYLNAPILNNTQITKKLGISQGQLSYQKRLLINKIKEVQR